MPPQYDSEGLAPFDSTWLAIASVRSVSIAYRRQSSHRSHIDHIFQMIILLEWFASSSNVFRLTYNSDLLFDLSFVV